MPPLFLSALSFGSMGVDTDAHHVDVDAVGEPGAAGVVTDEIAAAARERTGHVWA